MKPYISYPHVEGKASRQAHTDLPPGTYEREISKEGFFGPAAHLYHKHPPTGWTDFQGPLRPHAFDLTQLPGGQTSPWSAPEIVYNAALRMSFWRLNESMTQLARNADGDELLFVHAGGGELYCDFGHLSFETGDYILLPRGTMWRLEIEIGAEILLIEATNSSFSLPDKGLLGAHALFDAAMLDLPAIDAEFLAQQSDTLGWSVEVKRRGQISRISYPFNPLDAVGWHGDLAPCRLNVRDIRPVMSHRYHLPPSAHTTFVGHRFVVCTFVPRPLESDPGAIKVPFFHNNDDYDEMIFYHAGNFFSRDDIHSGMVTLHPSGFTHGPHPRALKNMLSAARTETDEIAVMIDARDALEIGPSAREVEWAGYVESWKSS